MIIINVFVVVVVVVVVVVASLWNNFIEDNGEVGSLELVLYMYVYVWYGLQNTNSFHEKKTK